MKDKTELLRNAITWLNETFVPLGLKPIEYFQPACPGKHRYCVIAEALKQNERWEHVTVQASGIDLGVSNPDEDPDYYLGTEYNTHEHFDMPEEVHNFITNYDDGEYPELVDLNLLDDHYMDYHDYRTDILQKVHDAGINIGERIEEIETTNVVLVDGVDVTNG